MPMTGRVSLGLGFKQKLILSLGQKEGLNSKKGKMSKYSGGGWDPGKEEAVGSLGMATA